LTNNQQLARRKEKLFDWSVYSIYCRDVNTYTVTIAQAFTKLNNSTQGLNYPAIGGGSLQARGLKG